MGTRLYWRFSERVPPFDTGKLIYRFYRESEKSGVETASLDRRSDTFDVLLIGGSVLHPDFGSIETRIAQKLPSVVHRPVRTFNLGNVGRTSRDSVTKYRRLASKRFHLVVDYDGINDVRMNNCPPRMFRDDYTHCSWYLWIDRLECHPEARWFALPYTLEYWAIDAIDSLDIGAFVPRHRPRASWLACGNDVRTDRTLTGNLRSLLTLAQERGDRFVLCTFAWHIPKDYSETAFRVNKLDYAKHGMPVEMWGRPANVAKAMELQNQAVRLLAQQNPQAILVDQDREIAKSAANFDDVCHLTEDGCKAFVDNLIAALAPRLNFAEVGSPTIK